MSSRESPSLPATFSQQTGTNISIFQFCTVVVLVTPHNPHKLVYSRQDILLRTKNSCHNMNFNFANMRVKQSAVIKFIYTMYKVYTKKMGPTLKLVPGKRS